MTDHAQMKEALEAAANIALCEGDQQPVTLSFTTTKMASVDDNGAMTGEVIKTTAIYSAWAKAAFAMKRAADAPTIDPPPIDPPPVVIPPTTSMAGKPVLLTGSLADGTAFNITAKPGDKIDIDPDRPQLGRFHYYPDGMCVRIENGYHDTPTDLSGDFTLTVAGKQLWSGPLTIWARGNTRPFWLETPTVRADADLSKFPKYGAGSWEASLYAKYIKADNSPMGIGLYSPAFSTTGERDDFGPLDRWSASYMVNPTAENAAVVLGMADAASVFPFHCVNRATGDLYDMSSNPKVSMLDAMYKLSGNPVSRPMTACRLDMTQAQAHATMFCALAAELFGTDYHKEELAAWANYVFSLNQNWGYRIFGVGCYAPDHGQVRGKGRGLDVLLYASEFSDRPDYFRRWVRAYGDACTMLFMAQSGLAIDQLGIIYDGGKGYGPYQQHLLVAAMGRAIEYGYSENYQAVFDYFAGPMMDAVLVDHEFATQYSVIVMDPVTGKVADTWADALKLNPKFTAALAQPEGSQARIDALYPGDKTYRAGDFYGYPSSASGFPAIMQPAMAMIADWATDKPRAQSSWDTFQKWQRINYTDDPKYNIVPVSIS